MRDHDDMRFYYETATFLLMLSAFVSAVVFTLTKYAVQSDVLIIGLATLLVAQTLLFPLIRSEQRLKRFKLPGGFEAEFFDELRNEAKQVKTGEPPQAVKEKLNEFERTEEEAAGVFLKIISEVEKRMREIMERSGIQEYRNVPFSRMVEQLNSRRILSGELAHLIVEFRMIRNEIIHGRRVMTIENLRDSISVGETILTELEKILTSTDTPGVQRNGRIRK